MFHPLRERSLIIVEGGRQVALKILPKQFDPLIKISIKIDSQLFLLKKLPSIFFPRNILPLIFLQPKYLIPLFFFVKYLYNLSCIEYSILKNLTPNIFSEKKITPSESFLNFFDPLYLFCKII